MSNYPNNSDVSYAPFNQEEYEEKEIEVTISLTLSKTVKIKVNDYEVEEGKDEDGYYYKDIDYSNCDLKGAIKEQLYLPNEAGLVFNELESNIPKLKDVDLVENFNGWIVDDYEVIIEQ